MKVEVQEVRLPSTYLLAFGLVFDAKLCYRRFMYLAMKSLHIVFIVAWFAGLFYIFRLFVYHRANHTNTDICRLLEVMEKKLLSVIIAPASVIVALFGGIMLYLNPPLLQQPWLWVKFLGVIGLYIYQWFSFYTYRRFKKNDFFLSEKQCRWINEIPTIFLLIIVFLAINKYSF